jgi:putative heme-binding domain-containing protein
MIEAIRAAADLGGASLQPVLISLASSKNFGIQQAALAALAGRTEWTHAMLDAIASNKISAVGFPISVRRSLATSKDKAVRDHAFKVLGAWKEASEDVKALIAAKRKVCLEGEPDMAMGKMLFTTTCATCHTFHGGGQKVGPELIGSGRSNLDAILANVIDPNQIIGNGYEAINVTTKDNRTLSGRMIEDTPSHVKLLGIGGAEQIVHRDQIAKFENTHQSTMPMGFGALPDDAFRSLIWYVLAPPEEGPLTKEKKAALSASMDAAPAKKPTGPSTRAIDWESISLWNPQWKVGAPDFERTPMKMPEYYGRSNVLLMHPFTKEKPATLERTMKLEAGKPHKLSVTVAAHHQGDWELRILVNGAVVKKEIIGHDGERWKTVTADLSQHAGKQVTLRLEGAANGWSYEFGYWGEVKVE